jgi:hypothetical protein
MSTLADVPMNGIGHQALFIFREELLGAYGSREQGCKDFTTCFSR